MGIDVKEGVVTIKDDIGNAFTIDSGNSILKMISSEGAFIEINKRNIKIDCDNFELNAENNISEKSTRKRGQYSAGWNTETPVHSQLGNYSITGGITGSPGATGDGIELEGIMRIRGDMIVNGISFINHRHPETNSGNTLTPV